VTRKVCSPVVLSVLRQPARLCEIRYSWKVGQRGQSSWVPSLARLINKIFCTFFYNGVPSWTADTLICFKNYYDCKICPWPKWGLLNPTSKSHFCGLSFVNSLYIWVRWWNTLTLHLLCTRIPKETELCSVLCPCPVLCPACSNWVICPIQKFSHASSKETSRKSVQRWYLGSRPQLEHTHNAWLLNMFSGGKKASYKIILTGLAGLAEELYNITALLATFFSLLWEFTAPLP